MATVHQEGSMAKPRPVTNVQVHVVADDRNGTLNYRLAPGDPPAGQFVKGDRLIEVPHSTDLFKLHFHMIDRDSSRKLVFNPAMPICAHDGSSCPTSGGIKTKQFEQDGAVHTKKLTIVNFNSAKGPVTFSLFFNDENSGNPVDPFDPIVDNGGGGGPSIFLER